MGNDDVWISSIPFNEWQFTKRDVFDLLEADSDEIKNTPQRQGSFLYIRKTKHSIDFINKWLECCCDIDLLAPENLLSGKENPDGFYANREDQSIISVLSKKEGITAHQDPSQFGKRPELLYKRLGKEYANVSEIKEKREYPVSILLHRTGDLNKTILLKQFLMILLPKSVIHFIKK